MITVTHHFTTNPLKRIAYSRLDHDYSAFYDEIFIGFYPTYLEAETALNAYVLDLITDGLDRTAKELDQELA